MASTDTDGFSLVLLAYNKVSPRLQVALSRAVAGNSSCHGGVLQEVQPTILAAGLSLADAALGQFELACADAAAVFLRDDVIRSGKVAYLQQLFLELLASPEFRWVRVSVATVPDNDHGVRFAQQFLDTDPRPRELPLPVHQPAMLKKARAMVSWGERIGAQVVIEDT